MSPFSTRFFYVKRPLLIVIAVVTIALGALGGSVVYANIVGEPPSPPVAQLTINITGLDLADDPAPPGEETLIELLSVSQAIDRPGTGTGATRRRGDVVLGDIVIVKKIDKSSPKIAQAVCGGKRFAHVEIDGRSINEKGERLEYYRYELKNVRISSYSFSSLLGDVPTEEIKLNYEEIRWTYFPQDGSAAVSWSGVNRSFNTNSARSSCPG